MKKIVDGIAHLFTPQANNNYRAKLLHHDLLTVYLVFAIILTAAVAHLQNTQGSIMGFATDISPQKLFELTNRERENNGLAALKYNDELAQAAKKKAENMFENNYWAHYGPNGETPWDFILDSGYEYEFAGENLAKNFLFSDGVVSAWMDSPTHKDNILRKEYTEVGFAVVNGVLEGEDTTLVVQMFGTPLYKQGSGIKENQKTDSAVVKDNIGLIDNNSDTNNYPAVEPSKNQTPNFFSLLLDINLVFFGILILALGLDFYFASKLNLIHIKGKNLIHILFLGSMIIGSYFVIRGSIL